MKKVMMLSGILAAAISVPAQADDAMDTDAMLESAAPKQYQAAFVPSGPFDLALVGENKPASFMATMSSEYIAGYRLSAAKAPKTDQSAGALGLIVPAEFAYRSQSQDTGVDATLPGSFQSTQLRSDRLNTNSPADYDKSALGIKLPF